jgi:hypothetical protein
MIQFDYLTRLSDTRPDYHPAAGEHVDVSCEFSITMDGYESLMGAEGAHNLYVSCYYNKERH